MANFLADFLASTQLYVSALGKIAEYMGDFAIVLIASVCAACVYQRLMRMKQRRRV